MCVAIKQQCHDHRPGLCQEPEAHGYISMSFFSRKHRTSKCAFGRGCGDDHTFDAVRLLREKIFGERIFAVRFDDNRCRLQTRQPIVRIGQRVVPARAVAIDFSPCCQRDRRAADAGEFRAQRCTTSGAQLIEDEIGESGEEIAQVENSFHVRYPIEVGHRTSILFPP